MEKQDSSVVFKQQLRSWKGQQFLPRGDCLGSPDTLFFALELRALVEGLPGPAPLWRVH